LSATSSGLMAHLRLFRPHRGTQSLRFPDPAVPVMRTRAASTPKTAGPFPTRKCHRDRPNVSRGLYRPSGELSEVPRALVRKRPSRSCPCSAGSLLILARSGMGPKPASGYDLRLSRRLRDQIRDRVGLRYEGKVACFHLDRLRAHALRHEAFEIGINRAVFRGDGIPARL